MKKKILTAAVICGLFGGAASVQAADIIGFDPAGTSTFVDIGSFDWLPGNALAQGAVSVGGTGNAPRCRGRNIHRLQCSLWEPRDQTIGVELQRPHERHSSGIGGAGHAHVEALEQQADRLDQQ